MKPWEKYASPPSDQPAGPWSKYAAAPASDEFIDPEIVDSPDVSMLESLIRGGGQGLSLSLQDEGAGHLNAIKDTLTGDRSVMTPGYWDSYKMHRDESRKRNREAKEANPWTYGTSNFVGAVAPAVIATLASGGTATPGLLAGGAKVLAPRTAAGLAGLAAVEGFGHSEAEDPTMLARDTALSALLGYGTGKAVPMLGRGLKTGLRSIQEGAEEGAGYMGSKALGMTKAVRKKIGLERANEIGRMALEPVEGMDKPIITAFADPFEMKGRAEALKNLSGGRISAIEEGLDAAKIHMPDANRMMTELSQRAEKYMGIEGARPLLNQYKKAISDMNRYQLNPTFENLQRLKNVYKDLAYPKGVLAEQKVGFIDAFHAIKNELDKSIEEGVEKVVASGTMGSADKAMIEKIPEIYKSSKQHYGASKSMLKGLEERISSEEGNRFVRPTDFVVGGAFGLGGGVVPAVTSVAAKRGIEKYGHQIGAIGANKLAKFLAAAPQRFGKYAPVLQQASQRGPQHLAVTHYTLQQKDPAYREMITQMETESGFNDE